MHRKSAYILFLAVLGLLVIGIVMLFSTSAFARDSHGDVYFFIKRQSIWFGIGLVVCIFVALIDYHFWQRTWWLWFSLYEKAGNNVTYGFLIPIAVISLLGGLVLGEVDLGTTALLGTTAFVVMFVVGANGPTLRLSPSAKFQRRCRFAADAGPDRLGQWWNGRAWLG